MGGYKNCAQKCAKFFTTPIICQAHFCGNNMAVKLIFYVCRSTHKISRPSKENIGLEYYKWDYAHFPDNIPPPPHGTSYVYTTLCLKCIATCRCVLFFIIHIKKRAMYLYYNRNVVRLTHSHYAWH